ncbi:MAG: ATP-binding protein [Salinibacter sp.]
MSVLAKEYSDLNYALDEVRPVIEEWSASVDGAEPCGETIHYTQLVLHEWIANLLQHASFDEQSPSLRIRLACEDQRIRCVVVDNSSGFDLADRLPVEQEAMEDLPERGMGLRMIDACTDDLSYAPMDDGRHRFEFSIPADHDPWLNKLF